MPLCSHSLSLSPLPPSIYFLLIFIFIFVRYTCASLVFELKQDFIFNVFASFILPVLLASVSLMSVHIRRSIIHKLIVIIVFQVRCPRCVVRSSSVPSAGISSLRLPHGLSLAEMVCFLSILIHSMEICRTTFPSLIHKCRLAKLPSNCVCRAYLSLRLIAITTILLPLCFMRGWLEQHWIFN